MSIEHPGSFYLNRELPEELGLERTISDAVLGEFNVLRGAGGTLYLQKRFLSPDLEIYAKIKLFLGLAAKRHAAICPLFSLSTEELEQGEFELIFEHYLELIPTFNDEAEIWILIFQLLTGLSSLENSGVPYPQLSKRFIYKGLQGYFLLHPFVFPIFLGEVLSIYLNPLVGVSQKRAHHSSKLTNSLQEFQILVISLVSGFPDEAKLAQKKGLFSQALQTIKENYSVYLFYFCSEVLKNAVGFAFLLDFFTSNFNRFPEKFKTFYRNWTEKSGHAHIPRTTSLSKNGQSIVENKMPSLRDLMLKISADENPKPRTHSSVERKSERKKLRIRFQLETASGIAPYKLIEYSDGTTEKQPLTQAEKIKIFGDRFESRRGSFAEAQKKAFGAKQKAKWSLMVSKGDSTLLLNEAEMGIDKPDFEEMKKVVDVNEPLRPSKYHAELNLVKDVSRDRRGAYRT